MPALFSPGHWLPVLDSLQALRNGRAALLLALTCAAAGLLLAAGDVLSVLSVLLSLPFHLAAFGVAVYGASAVGMVLMDEVQGQPPRPLVDALLVSLATSHRLMLVLALWGGLGAALVAALALLVAVCNLPGMGPLLYTLVYPVGTVAVAAWAALGAGWVLPVSAPAVWQGQGLAQCLAQLSAAARQRLLPLMATAVAVGLLTAAVGLAVAAVLWVGEAVMNRLSATLLQGAWEAVAAARTGTRVNWLWATAAAVPGLVWLRGIAAAHATAVEGLDLQAEQRALAARLSATRDRARELQAQAQAAARRYAERSEAAAAAVSPSAGGGGESPDAASASPAVPAADPVLTGGRMLGLSAPERRCKACGHAADPSDRYCSQCGQTLADENPGLAA